MTYQCDSEGTPICLMGWKEPDNETLININNPCPEPICDSGGTGCVHGTCTEPRKCSCEIGW
jgi:hypothetical protein